MSKIKVAITVSAEVLREIERLRKVTGESRSAVCERALRGFLAEREARAASRRYVDAYRRQRESAAEVRTALTMALAALALEPWHEAG